MSWLSSLVAEFLYDNTKDYYKKNNDNDFLGLSNLFSFKNDKKNDKNKPEEKTYTGDGGDFGGHGASKEFYVYPDIEDILNTFLQSFASSAMDAELAAADRVNSFNAEQAKINRLFQESSAEKAMQFSADQAEIDRNFQQSSAEKAMQFSADQAQKQMDFQERMSNTAYQRAVQDLKAAGLSPLLAYSNFSTSSPGGSSGVGYSSSGAMASGVSSSGSSAAGVKANPSAGKTADISTVISAISSLIGVGVSSVSDIWKWSSKANSAKRF